MTVSSKWARAYRGQGLDWAEAHGVTPLANGDLLLSIAGAGLIVARTDDMGRIDSPCMDSQPLVVDHASITLPDRVDHATPVAPEEELGPLPDAGLATGPVVLDRTCLALPCEPLACLSIDVTPAMPCAGEDVLLSLQFTGGEGAVSVEWDLDGDTVGDVIGNPASVTLDAGSHDVTALATDSCAAGPDTCMAATTVVVVGAPLDEVSDVRAGDHPLTVAAGSLDVTFQLQPGAGAHHARVGTIGSWYGPGSDRCVLDSWRDEGDGTATAWGLLTDAGSSWVLITAADPCSEGPAGADSMSVERETDPSWVTCGPAP